MPNIAMGEPVGQRELTEGMKKDYGYEYPEGLDLRPKSQLHKDLVSALLERARESANVMTNRFPSWNNIDRVLTTYAVVDEEEENLQKQDERRPVSIVFPYSYVILETMLSYLVGAFFQTPIFQYEGVAPEDMVGSKLLEYVVQHHVVKSKISLNLHTMLRDGLGYGFGLGAPGWREQHGYKTIIEKTIFGTERFREERVLFEGNDLSNIDPYKALPDPNKPIHEIQEGEFFGYIDSTNLMRLLEEEQYDDDLFNVKFLKHVVDKKTSIYSDDNSYRNKKAGGDTFRKAHSVTNETDVIKMYVTLIPKDWKIGDGEEPEKWEFWLGADAVILKAKPAGFDHNMYPIASCAPDFDGYSVTPVSRMEVLFGLQHILDWLFNTHIANVRKAINDMFVIDPFIVNVEDLKSPKPGKIIRTRRPAWGKGVKDAVQQLGVTDVTRANISDSGWIMEYMERIGAADQSMQGGVRRSGPERLTGKEFEGTRAGSFSRMERVAKVIGIQAMQDLGYFFASHTQQMMEEETYIKTVGTWPETLAEIYGNQERIPVTPYDLNIDYDVIVRDGSVPGGNFSPVWVDMFKVLAEHPELAQQFDTVRIFKHIAVNSGAKDVNQFIRAVPMQNEDVEKNLDRGNIIPMQEGGVNL